MHPQYRDAPYTSHPCTDSPLTVLMTKYCAAFQQQGADNFISLIDDCAAADTHVAEQQLAQWCIARLMEQSDTGLCMQYWLLLGLLQYSIQMLHLAPYVMCVVALSLNVTCCTSATTMCAYNQHIKNLTEAVFLPQRWSYFGLSGCTAAGESKCWPQPDHGDPP